MHTFRQRICGLLKLHLNIRRDVPITKTTRIFTGNAAEQISCAHLKIISLIKIVIFFPFMKCKAGQGDYVTSYCRIDLMRRAESFISTVRRKIRLIEGNQKCSDLKKSDFAAKVYLSEAQNPIHPPYTQYVYTVYLFTQGREVDELNQRKG